MTNKLKSLLDAIADYTLHFEIRRTGLFYKSINNASNLYRDNFTYRLLSSRYSATTEWPGSIARQKGPPIWTERKVPGRRLT